MTISGAFSVATSRAANELSQRIQEANPGYHIEVLNQTAANGETLIRISKLGMEYFQTAVMPVSLVQNKGERHWNVGYGGMTAPEEIYPHIAGSYDPNTRSYSFRGQSSADIIATRIYEANREYSNHPEKFRTFQEAIDLSIRGWHDIVAPKAARHALALNEEVAERYGATITFGLEGTAVGPAYQDSIQRELLRRLNTAVGGLGGGLSWSALRQLGYTLDKNGRLVPHGELTGGTLFGNEIFQGAAITPLSAPGKEASSTPAGNPVDIYNFRNGFNRLQPFVPTSPLSMNAQASYIQSRVTAGGEKTPSSYFVFPSLLSGVAATPGGGLLFQGAGETVRTATGVEDIGLFGKANIHKFGIGIDNVQDLVNANIQFDQSMIGRQLPEGRGSYRLGTINEYVASFKKGVSSMWGTGYGINLPEAMDIQGRPLAPGMPGAVSTEAVQEALQASLPGVEISRGGTKLFGYMKTIDEAAVRLKSLDIKAQLLPGGKQPIVTIGGVQYPISMMTGELKGPQALGRMMFGTRSAAQTNQLVTDWMQAAGTEEATKFGNWFISRYGNEAHPRNINLRTLTNKLKTAGLDVKTGVTWMNEVVQKVILEARGERNVRNIQQYALGVTETPTIADVQPFSQENYAIILNAKIREIRLKDPTKSEAEARGIAQQTLYVQGGELYQVAPAGTVFGLVGAGLYGGTSAQGGVLESVFRRGIILSNPDVADFLNINYGQPQLDPHHTAITGLLGFVAWQKSIEGGTAGPNVGEKGYMPSDYNIITDDQMMRLRELSQRNAQTRMNPLDYLKEANAIVGGRPGILNWTGHDFLPSFQDITEMLGNEEIAEVNSLGARTIRAIQNVTNTGKVNPVEKLSSYVNQLFMKTDLAKTLLSVSSPTTLAGNLGFIGGLPGPSDALLTDAQIKTVIKQTGMNPTAARLFIDALNNGGIPALQGREPVLSPQSIGVGRVYGPGWARRTFGTEFARAIARPWHAGQLMMATGTVVMNNADFDADIAKLTIAAKAVGDHLFTAKNIRSNNAETILKVERLTTPNEVVRNETNAFVSTQNFAIQGGEVVAASIQAAQNAMLKGTETLYKDILERGLVVSRSGQGVGFDYNALQIAFLAGTRDNQSAMNILAEAGMMQNLNIDAKVAMDAMHGSPLAVAIATMNYSMSPEGKAQLGWKREDTPKEFQGNIYYQSSRIGPEDVKANTWANTLLASLATAAAAPVTLKSGQKVYLHDTLALATMFAPKERVEELKAILDKAKSKPGAEGDKEVSYQLYNWARTLGETTPGGQRKLATTVPILTTALGYAQLKAPRPEEGDEYGMAKYKALGIFQRLWGAPLAHELEEAGTAINVLERFPRGVSDINSLVAVARGRNDIMGIAMEELAQAIHAPEGPAPRTVLAKDSVEADEARVEAQEAKTDVAAGGHATGQEIVESSSSLEKTLGSTKKKRNAKKKAKATEAEGAALTYRDLEMSPGKMQKLVDKARQINAGYTGEWGLVEQQIQGAMDAAGFPGEGTGAAARWTMGSGQNQEAFIRGNPALMKQIQLENKHALAIQRGMGIAYGSNRAEARIPEEELGEMRGKSPAMNDFNAIMDKELRKTTYSERGGGGGGGVAWTSQLKEIAATEAAYRSLLKVVDEHGKIIAKNLPNYERMNDVEKKRAETIEKMTPEQQRALLGTTDAAIKQQQLQKAGLAYLAGGGDMGTMPPDQAAAVAAIPGGRGGGAYGTSTMARLGGAARTMLGGWGLMYAQRIGGLITEGIGWGSQQAGQVQEAMAGVIGQQVGMPSVYATPQQRAQLLMGVSGGGITATTFWQQYQAQHPDVRAGVQAGTAAMAAAGYTLWGLGEVGALGANAATAGGMAGALAGIAAPLVIGAAAIAGVASVSLSAAALATDPRSLAYRLSKAGFTTEQLKQAQKTGGGILPYMPDNGLARANLGASLGDITAGGAWYDQTPAQKAQTIQGSEIVSALKNGVDPRVLSNKYLSSDVANYLASSYIDKGWINDAGAAAQVASFQTLYGGDTKDKRTVEQLGSWAAYGIDAMSMVQKAYATSAAPGSAVTGIGPQGQKVPSMSAETVTAMAGGEKAPTGLAAVHKTGRAAEAVAGLITSPQQMAALSVGVGRFQNLATSPYFDLNKYNFKGTMEALQYLSPAQNQWLQSAAAGWVANPVGPMPTAANVPANVTPEANTREAAMAAVQQQYKASMWQGLYQYNPLTVASAAIRMNQTTMPNVNLQTSWQQAVPSWYASVMGINQATGLPSGRPYGEASFAGFGVSPAQMIGNIWGANPTAPGGYAQLQANYGNWGAQMITQAGGYQPPAGAPVRPGMGKGWWGEQYFGTQKIQAMQAQEQYNLSSGAAGIAMTGALSSLAFATGVGINQYNNINPQTGQYFNIGAQSYGFNVNIPGQGNASYTSQGGGLWGVEDAQRYLGYAQQKAGFQFQQRGLNLQTSQFYQSMGLQARGIALGRAQGTEEYQYGTAMAQQQFGFGQTMFREEERFTSGRERRLAEMQNKENVTVYNMETAQRKKEFGYQKEQWALQEAQYRLQIKQFEETKKLQEDQLKTSIKFWQENKKLTEDAVQLQRAEFIENNKLSQESAGLQQQAAQDALDAAKMSIKYGDSLGNVNGMMSNLNDLLIALDPNYQKFLVDLENTILLMGGTVPTLISGSTTTTNPTQRCFVAGTQVSMADGSTKNIEDIQLGDMVLSWNEDWSLVTASKVLGLHHTWSDRICELRFENGSTLQLTKEHPMYTEQGWKCIDPVSYVEDNPSKLLSIGDKVLTQSGEVIEITEIVPVEAQPVFNLSSVETTHTFYVNGFLAHNKMKEPQATGGTVYSGGSAIVGDSLTGVPTGYEETVAALPGGGFRVYPHNQTVAQMAGGGIIPSYMNRTIIPIRNQSQGGQPVIEVYIGNEKLEVLAVRAVRKDLGR